MRTGLTALVLAALLALTACGEESPTDPAGQAGEAAPTPTEEPAEEAEAEGQVEPAGDAAATLAVASTDLGDVLVDGDGMTLYVFDPDAQSASTCYDDCAQAWPPLLADAAEAGDGVDAALIGTATRDDGTEQVTYDGWPLYRWAGDDAPGDTTGQGVQDVWWVIAADGAVQRGDAPGEEDTGGEDTGGLDY